MINHNILDNIIKNLDPLTIFKLTRLNKKINSILDKYIFYTINLDITRLIPITFFRDINASRMDFKKYRYKIHICVKNKFTYQNINTLWRDFELCEKYIGSTYFYTSFYTLNQTIVHLDSINNLSYNGLTSS